MADPNEFPPHAPRWRCLATEVMDRREDGDWVTLGAYCILRIYAAELQVRVAELEGELRVSKTLPMPMPVEHCCDCDAVTGRAGRGDDSIYCNCGRGPFCSECWKEHQEQCPDAEKEE